jgi:hypothetical protein
MMSRKKISLEKGDDVISDEIGLLHERVLDLVRDAAAS